MPRFSWQTITAPCRPLPAGRARYAMTVASPLGNVTGPATTAGSFVATESGLRPGCAPAVA